MRSSLSMALLLAFSLAAIPAFAASSDEIPAEQEAIQALETKASQAKPKDQCFLYAEILHRLTDLSLRQYAAGNVGPANLLLRQIQQVSRKIHLSVARNDKRLKHAEIVLSSSAFRLTELLHSSDYNDRALIKQTIADVNQAQDAAMMQVFNQ
ncbi:MAG TPA: hypothetical protein VGS10_09930 [Terracidiphilus sp.]|nr:hypothetical protein [Terracidiphilus sp.]